MLQRKKKRVWNGQIQDLLSYQDIAKNLRLLRKVKRLRSNEKKFCKQLRLQNSLQMVRWFWNWTKTFQDLLLSTYQYDHPWKWDNHRAYYVFFFFIPEQYFVWILTISYTSLFAWFLFDTSFILYYKSILYMGKDTR